MSDIKKRQHYVWRYYLRAWAKDERIWTYFKELNKVQQPSLMAVGQEKYFYKLIDLADNEEQFLKKLIEHISPASVRELNLTFFDMFTSAYKLKKSLEKSSLNDTDKDKLAKDIHLLENNLMEDAHCKIEALGRDLLNCKNIDELKTLADNEDEGLLDAIMFLSFQYFRTSVRKKAVIEGFKNDLVHFQELAKKTWNIVSYCMSTKFARNISIDPKTRFVFIDNQTDTGFITCDQPIFNMLADVVDENGDVTELELYYPLSPKTALIIHFRDDQTERFINEIIDVEKVEYLNGKVLEHADFFVFADNKEQLDKLIK